ncbi:carboxypeptidase-like regulatory domain-containing protein [Spongiivirga citrea]|uniref:Carboxypeptidase-like regulatory domain-containing protein n=1 Tax=Spongiivirga citrea TaxID=1481457 RepID=A0A6M0CRB6_9FLAO|nr:carboxypeptidase-like regulatory domain-containing protein [Spongiivirga citrea]NER18057.1 hypothetical protein [Spongiivirga citrea]
MKLFLGLFLFLNIGIVSCQTLISGTIFDEKTNEPLEGVSVYFDGTTIGVVTNSKGFFELELDRKIKSALVISYLGYFDIVTPNPYDKEGWKIYLREKAFALQGVTLKADPFTREEKLEAFKAQFLGTNKNGQSCKILNEDYIHVAYDVTTNQLLASSEVPIIVNNKLLGYENRFSLNDFYIKFRRKTLSTFAIKETYYEGTSFFIDKQKNNQKYLKNRNDAYEGSILHLMRTIRIENYENEKFYFFRGKAQLQPNSHIEVVKRGDYAKVIFPDFILSIWFEGRRSEIIKKANHLIIDKNGNFSPPTAVRFNGDLGRQRVGNMLPFDFLPKE